MKVRTLTFLPLLLGSVALAEPSDVPKMPDGTTDLSAIFGSFSVMRPISTTGPLREFKGSLLGLPFSATYTDPLPTRQFELTIRTGLSEEGTFHVAVLLTDLICLDLDRRSDLTPWHQTARPIPGGWTVQGSCSEEPRSAAHIGG